MLLTSLPGDLFPDDPLRPARRPPRGRRGTPEFTPETFYERIGELDSQTTMVGLCVLCRRRKGTSFAVRRPPEGSRLASTLPDTPDQLVITVCGRCSRRSPIRELIDEFSDRPDRTGDPPMLTTESLRSPTDILLVGDLFIHRNGPEPRRPCLALSVHCPACRSPHEFGWPDLSRPDSVQPVDLPCPGGSPFPGRRVFAAIDPNHRAENRRTQEDFAAKLRRFLVERRLERDWLDSQAEERKYFRDFDGQPLSPPVDHLAAGWIPPLNSFPHPLSPSM
jgi:hypothetical protein